MEVAAIVLAGGKSRRLGRRKALETIGGKSLIERVIDRLEPLTNQILIVTSRAQFALPFDSRAKKLVDVYPDKGPLGGIYTGLLASTSFYGVVVACDMPFLNTELLHYLVELSPNYDAVVPRLAEDRVQPLHAVYSKNCLETMKIRLEQNQWGVTSFLNTLKVRYVDQADCQRFDPQLLSFFSVNDQLELDRALTLAFDIEGLPKW